MKNVKRTSGKKATGTAPAQQGEAEADAPEAQTAPALAGRSDVIELANELTRAADTLHRRLNSELKKDKIDQADAQSLLEDEALLRQRANSLELDAAEFVLKELPLAQDKLIAAIGKARSRIEKLDEIAIVVDLAADLTLLAGALLTAKATPFLTALKKLKADGTSLDKIK